ncbi:hypothetical protein Tco_1255106 [Tanacetum coccineum]
MTDSTKDIFNVVYISSRMLTVGHPNGTLAKITAIGSLRLTSGIVLFDVLVVPEYNVSLLSVNKMIKDSKLCVGFNEHKCYIHDLNLGVGTSSESGGLYLFDIYKIGGYVNAKSNYVFVCHVSSVLWHYRLSHPANQVLSILGISEENSLNFFDFQGPERPYDEEGGSSNVEGNTWVTSDDYDNIVEDEVINVAT